jgi:ABC-type branched-subunit amino acid transport system permease subunit
MSTQPMDRLRSGFDPLIDAYRGHDLLLIATVMLGIYLIFIAVSVAIGLGLNGTVSTLQQVTFLTAVYAMLVLALNLHWGYTGLFNIGVAGFVAVGIYTFAMLTAPPTGTPPGLGLPLPVGIIGGMIAAAVVGLVVSLPALRLDADYFAIVTLAFSEIIRLVYNSPLVSSFTINGVELGSGGASGIGFPNTDDPIRVLYDSTPLGDIVFGVTDPLSIQPSVVYDWTYTLVLVVFVALFYVFLTRTAQSPFGRVLKAIREDEIVARSLGKNTQLFKIKSFMVGCALMGLCGILWWGTIGYVSPINFRPLITFYVFIALIIGGSGSNTGSVIGAAVFAGLLFYLPQLLNQNAGQVIQLLRDILGGSGTTPNTFIEAVVALTNLDTTAVLAYIFANTSSLRFVAIGIILVLLMQHRSEGLLGHRIETASSVNLSRQSQGGDDNE